jgi:hypothetical protein
MLRSRKSLIDTINLNDLCNLSAVQAYDDLTQLKADASLSDSGDEDNLKDKRKSEDNKNANKWSAALKKKLDELAKTDGQCTERKVELVKKLKVTKYAL